MLRIIIWLHVLGTESVIYAGGVTDHRQSTEHLPLTNRMRGTEFDVIATLAC